MSKYYAVVRGKIPGIYNNWKETELQVKGFSGAIYKGFKTKNEAEEFMKKSTITEKHDVAKTTSNQNIIYTDGSCKDKMCGFGVIILTPNQEKYTVYGKVPESIYDKSTKQQFNDVAELYAIYVALSLVEGNITLYTDCNYAVTTLTTYIHDWIKNDNFSKRENHELIKGIYDKMSNRIINYQHINGHVGIKYNEECDILADKGRIMTTDEIVTSKDHI